MDELNLNSSLAIGGSGVVLAKDDTGEKKACVMWLCEHPNVSEVCSILKNSLGEASGESAYKLLCEMQAEVLRNSGFSVFVCFKGSKHKAEMMKWLGPKYRYHTIGEENFANELENLFYFAFSKGYHYLNCVFELIPMLNSKDICEVFKLLDEYDTVLGPSSQGHVGMFAVYRPSFKLSMLKDVDFDSELSHMQIWENIRREGLSVEVMPEKLAVRNNFDYEALSLLPKNQNVKNENKVDENGDGDLVVEESSEVSSSEEVSNVVIDLEKTRGEEE